MIVDGHTVCAVVVTYRPESAALRSSIAAIAPQVASVVVVDNASPGLPDLGSDVLVLQQSTNVGLAAAQNIGIRWARDSGHTHVLILDQDSIPAQGMVAALMRAWRELSSIGRVGAVGPRFHDPREDRDAPFVRVAFPMSAKVWCDPSTKVVRSDFLISSGALIPIAVIDDIGAMDDGLFIDNVDMEWSFRARSRGYDLYGVCDATMEHRLGDARVGLPGGYEQVVHGPVRLYYIMRNRVALYRRSYTPRIWIAQDVPRVIAKLVIFGVLVGPRLRNVRFMLRGLADGARNRSGPCPIEAAA